LLTRALAKVAPQQPGALISLERPKQSQHGDFSCPAAMQLARVLKRNPRELALELVAALPPSEWLERAEVAGSGFIQPSRAPRRQAARREDDTGRGRALRPVRIARGTTGRGGIRFGQSHRAASRRQRQAGGARDAIGALLESQALA